MWKHGELIKYRRCPIISFGEYEKGKKEEDNQVLIAKSYMSKST